MSRETLEMLLVEDDTAYAALICRAFAPQAEAVRLTMARSLQEARIRIAESQPDLALIAWRLPDGAGIELIPTAREARPYPVIIMTTPGNVHVAVEAMKAGAVDCVVKSETPLSAIPRIAAQALRQWGESRERKRTEAELRKFSVAVEQSPSMIVMTDFDGIIEYVNAQFTQVTGYSPEDMHGTQLALPPSPCATVSGLWSTIQADGGWRGEWSNTTKNGASYLESMSISSLRNAAGDITHFLVVKADITAATHMQQHLAQAERLASLRTLAVGLAHELNQPLTAIRVPVDSLLYGHKRGWTITEERFVDSLQLVSAQCDRVAALLHDVRTFASGDATHHGGSGSLQEGLARVQRLIGTQIISHGIELQPQIPPELPRVCLHQADLEQVLMHLVSNARQALDGVSQSVKTITVTAVREAAEVVLCVADNGPGIAPEVRSQLFHPFFTTKASGGSIGLGLSIVHGFIAAANGDITVTESALGGAAFVVRLPITEE